MTWAEILTILVILIGPTIGVWLAKTVDETKEKRRRREEVFKTLMRTRRVPISLEHVGALNLVELEFEKEKEVLEAFKNHFEHLGTQHPKNARESQRDFDIRLGQERQVLLAKLLHAMAKTLNFKIEQLEIFEGGYTPQGWEDELTIQKYLQRGLANILDGLSSIKVTLTNPEDPAKNPPQKKPDKSG